MSNLVARGTLRVALKPLLDEIPIAGGIKVPCLHGRLGVDAALQLLNHSRLFMLSKGSALLVRRWFQAGTDGPNLGGWTGRRLASWVPQTSLTQHECWEVRSCLLVVEANFSID